MHSYDSLAAYYDVLTRDIDYDVWAEYYISHFAGRKRAVHTVLDLGCGTGSLAQRLAKKGYEMICVDGSEAMLSCAAGKSYEGTQPLFICQNMDELDLYGTVDAAICMLDGVNYITDSKALRRTFERVRLFLEPDGVFVFDINTPYKLESLDGEFFVDETENVFCAWHADMSERLMTYSFDIFSRAGKLWRRSEETHFEYAYTPEELKAMLLDAGFKCVELFGDMSHEAPENGEMRIFIKADKGQ